MTRLSELHKERQEKKQELYEQIEEDEREFDNADI
jgi:hypothetical protein